MTTQNKSITTKLFRSVVVGLMFIMSIPATAQEQTDSLIINVGKSKIIFLVRDKQDLETLKNYDLNAILNQLSLKLENDSTGLVKEENGQVTSLSDTTIVVDEVDTAASDIEDEEYSDNLNEEEEEDADTHEARPKGTRHFFNLDLGTNNYMQDGKFPDETDELYTVRPFGSWYVGINSVNNTYIGGPFYLEWGPSVTWYNFKFQNDRVRVIDGPDGTTFAEDTDLPDADFKKSKLTVAYANFTVVPMLSFGEATRKKRAFWDWYDKKDWDDEQRGFRIGVGGYAGYRIASYSKIVYDDGGKEKDKDKDNYNLNNFRYGLRLQMGYRGTDLFFNYDMNELFTEGKGPKLNAFSFGITF
ncbi:hypothetical protein GCM10009122_27550 [Fulvivirga kasyanovii]|uniref:Outer membrane protein beta-barrel domain-containing protein n=1 Tax=Fulvivirga kasyanovii TaxID=396812 RepID=A0ABW9RTD7_9BACT|nr:hypothetical protein [Fulvivirga kasyanovii]MTI27331.1 hypothetical protein [Fulvivirga kasyanovii]